MTSGTADGAMGTGTDPAARLAAHLAGCLGADSAWVPARRSRRRIRHRRGYIACSSWR